MKHFLTHIHRKHEACTYFHAYHARGRPVTYVIYSFQKLKKTHSQPNIAGQALLYGQMVGSI